MRGLARLGPVTFAVAGALSACSGPSELSLGTTGVPATKDVFIAPSGTPGALGTREDPLKTFAEALPRLRPGSSLTLLDGEYGAANGALKAKCDDVSVFSGADDAQRILVKADTPRGAWLRGDGLQPPIDLEGCRFWTVQDLRVESHMTTPPPAAPEGGSVVVLRADDHDIVLRGLLASTPNVNADAEVVVIGPGCSDVLLEANELYAFHHNGFEATRAGRLTFRRNYVNSRNTGDEAWPSENATRGDHAFLLEETRDVIAENNVVESVHIGFAVVGRDPKVDAAPGAPVANNRVLGNVVLGPSGVGVRIDSRCNAQNPCPASRTVIDTEIAHTVVIGGAAGISNAGAVNTRIHDVTIRNAANGMLAVKEPQNVAVRSTWSTVRTVAVVQNTAFKSGPDEAEWLFDHCAAVSSSGDPALFVTFNGNGSVKDRLPPPPDLGPCLLARPNADLGANVLEQTKDGVLMPGVALWAPGTAAFLGCGAVKDGANGAMDGDSCVGAQARLNLSACALP